MDIRKEINPADGSPQLVLTCAKGVAVAFVCGTLAVVMLSFAAGVILGRATIGRRGARPSWPPKARRRPRRPRQPPPRIRSKWRPWRPT
ncbi:MAG TPA: hypothetical protein PLI98_13150, partial [Candidatus Hydrogenedentes bacterium]|nr:hypothetical protein [Candidatus Hydrogenedentota bacterium]